MDTTPKTKQIKLTSELVAKLQEGDVLTFRPPFDCGESTRNLFEKNGFEPGDKVKYLKKELLTTGDNYALLVENTTPGRCGKYHGPQESKDTIHDRRKQKQGSRLDFHQNFFLIEVEDAD